METVNVAATETTVPNLMSSTTYSIQVAAVNSAGTGEFSDHIIVHTESKFTPVSTHSCVNTKTSTSPCPIINWL